MRTARIHNRVLTFGVMLAISGGVVSTMDLQVLAGFVIGVVSTLVAAAIAGSDFE